MKNLYVLLLLAFSATAFAGDLKLDTTAAGAGTGAKQGVVAGSASKSEATGGAGGSSAGNQTTQGNNALTVGCLVNCSDTTQGTKDLADSARDVALINGDTARAVAGTTATIRNTPSVSGPPLVSSNDTCMGSASGSVNAPGFGVSLGKTYTDDNCVMLKNSRELWNMGMKAASLALMCTDSANREALELTGFECPQTTRAKANGKHVPVATSDEYTDPIVRARLGLPVLK